MNITISWNELPVYGAKLIRQGILECPYAITVIATRPSVPAKGMDDLLGNSLRWIDAKKVNAWSEIGLPVPDIFFQAGVIYIPSFSKLGNEVLRNGGRVILLSDNSDKKSLRQAIRSSIFKLLYLHKFAGVWVPGSSGALLMKKSGFLPKNIFQGLYGSDNSIFRCGPPIPARPKNLIFIGRFVREKGIAELVRAFKKIHSIDSEWTLSAYGEGPLDSLLRNQKNIFVNKFSRPEDIAVALQGSRALILPTLTDHWPLVVNEAALCGCALIVSNKVGNSCEFVGSGNGIVYDISEKFGLERALINFIKMPIEMQMGIHLQSEELGKKFTPATWASRFMEIIDSSKNYYK
jgi:glycosyltransferase involved in cell wall biosynthesis